MVRSKKVVMVDTQHSPLPALSESIIDLLRIGKAHNRADLARLLGKAPSTVSIYVNDLLRRGIIEEHGETASTGGRKGRLLRLPTGNYFQLVADLGVNSVRFAAADLHGKLSQVHECSLDPSASADELFQRIVLHFRALLGTHPLPGKLSAICMGVPAPIDTTSGCIHSSARVPHWNHFPLVQRLSQAFHVPTFIENDANLIALAEDTIRGLHHDSLTLVAGRGIGVGIIIDGAIHRGATGNAGDISHVRHTTYGDKHCPCGNKGCLTTVADLDALTALWVEQGGEDSADALLTAARLADPIATNIIRQAGEQLGIALSTVVSFINPAAVYLAGPLSELDVFVSAIRTCIYGACHPLMTRDLRIETSVLGVDSELYGAAALARTHLARTLPQAM